MFLKIKGHPMPKERPRSRGGQQGVYQPITDYERQITATAKLEGSFFRGNVAVTCNFQCFGSRGDVDNLTKSCLDGLTESGCWKDDKCVVELHAFITKVSKEQEYTTITVTDRP